MNTYRPSRNFQPAKRRSDHRSSRSREKLSDFFPIRRPFARQRRFLVGVVEVRDRTKKQPFVDIARVDRAHCSKAIDEPHSLLLEQNVEIEEVSSRSPVENGVQLGGEQPRRREHAVIFYNNPTCAKGSPVNSPDIVFFFNSAFTGWVKYDIAKPSGATWVATANYESCGNPVSSSCDIDSASTHLTGIFGVAGNPFGGSTASYRYIVLATQGPGALENPVSITLTGMDSQGTGESCVTPLPITLGTNAVYVHPATNDHMTSTPACSGGNAITGGDIVLEYKAPADGTLNVTVNKPAASGWTAVISTACGDLTAPSACLYDFPNTHMSGKLAVLADHRYYVHVAATGQGAPLTAPIDVVLSQ